MSRTSKAKAKRAIPVAEFTARIERRRQETGITDLPRNRGKNRTESKEPKAARGQRFAQGHRGRWREVVIIPSPL